MTALRSIVVLLITALLGSGIGLLAGPRPLPLGPPTGDPGLAAAAGAVLERTGNDGIVSVAQVRDGQVTWAGFGEVEADSRFEIGSLTKTFTGLLLADAAERGEVTLDDPVSTHVPELAGTAAGSATLRELAQHTSGLPGMGSLDTVRLMAEDLAGAPYTVYRQATTDSVIADVAAAASTARGTWAYSNLGLSLLGAALARAAGAPDWATLADERIFTPLSMTATQVAAPGAPAPDLLQPHNPNGSPMAGQTGTGYGPAGIGVTSTASDLARYAQALMDGTAPGVSALEPTLDITDGPLAGQQMGLAWVVAPADSGAVVWHNGMTGGMASMFALDLAQDRAVILLTDRARDLTGAGLLLLADGAEGTDGADGAGAALPAAPPHVDADTVGWVGAGVVLVLAFAWASVRSRSRLRLAGQGLAALGSLAIWVLARPFDWAPPWTLGLALGLFVGALLVSGLRWPALGWLPERWRALTIAVAVLGVIWFVAMAAFAVWVLGLGGR